jgi:hypothetical protein
MSEFKSFDSFEEFWPHYLREHSRAETRALHIAGTSLAGVGLVAWLATHKGTYLGLAVVGAYGLAWLGHLMFEHNKPAAFDNPLWSLRADLLMYRLWLSGKLDEEVKRVFAVPYDGMKASVSP